MSYRLLVKKVVAIFSNVCSSTNITSSAYVQLSAKLLGTIEALHVSNSSTATFALASGTSGNEVNQVLIGPGQTQVIPTEDNFPAGSRLSVISIDTSTVSSGTLAINALAG